MYDFNIARDREHVAIIRNSNFAQPDAPVTKANLEAMVAALRSHNTATDEIITLDTSVPEDLTVIINARDDSYRIDTEPLTTMSEVYGDVADALAECTDRGDDDDDDDDGDDGDDDYANLSQYLMRLWSLQDPHQVRDSLSSWFGSFTYNEADARSTTARALGQVPEADLASTAGDIALAIGQLIDNGDDLEGVKDYLEALAPYQED